MFGKKNAEKITEVYCAICHNKSGFAGYSPKKEWNVNGKLCSKCFARLLGEHNKKATVDTNNKIYGETTNAKQVVTNDKKEESKMDVMTQTAADPLSVLKLRLAKGEIRKEEYLELRKMLES